MNNTSKGEGLESLCAHLGLATRYNDVWGHDHEVPEASLRKLLKAMDLDAETDEAAQRTVAGLKAKEQHRLMPSVLVLRQGQPASISVTLPKQAPQVESDCRYTWTLACENAERFGGLMFTRQDGCPEALHLQIDLPQALPLGYHQLTLRSASQSSGEMARTRVIVCPTRCHEPKVLRQGERLWGPSIQLYALRSNDNWGIGDFSDLKRLLEIVAGQGASFVGVNPLHALFPHEPERASPYSPSSRNALNVLYLDVTAVQDFAECRFALDLVNSVLFQQRLQALREPEIVNYRAVAAAKFEVLEMLFKHFHLRHLSADTHRGRAFRAFQKERGSELRRQALFETLQAHFHAQDSAVWGWSLWPQAYRDPESLAVADFEREHEVQVEFFEYLQWQAELQLQSAQARAESLGMAIGLYRDLAVGVNEGGAETWSRQNLYAMSLHVGAPPEEYNLAGQDWGLPPMIPSRLRDQDFQPFIDTLRANMRCAGALRIDHVMALMRLFWIHPEDGAKSGAYMSYPFEEMMGILALESHHHRCLVIGEDLGTVPPAMREAMREQYLLSYCPLFFERTHDGRFKPPADWPLHALAVVSTHDLPTLRGFWNGKDVDLRTELGLFPSEEVRAQQVVGRAQDRAQLLLALAQEGVIPQGSVHPPGMDDTSPAFTDAVYSFLGRTPSQLVGVQLEDVTQQLIQVNIPGTSESQFPNWRRKLGVTLESLASDPRLLSIGAALRRARPSDVAPHTPLDELPPLATAVIPRATYRVQLHKDFRFSDAMDIVPYLDALGISHLYTSPYLRARAGSTHGYDVVDHNALNPEIGDEGDFERLCATLLRHGMHQLIDIVPNHMGVLEADNAWWLDVLESGPASVHAETFDIDWNPPAPELVGQVLLPVLGDHYGKVLEAGELKLSFDALVGEFWIHYHDHRFPIDPRHYADILAVVPAPTPTDESVSEEVQIVQSLLHALASLPLRGDGAPSQRAVRQRDKGIHKRRLAQLASRFEWLGHWADACLSRLNGTPGDAASFDLLDALIRQQAYRLAFWRVAGDDINYRRFFDINTLASVRMERDAVFEATHQTIFQWLRARKVAGLRVDHPDGLCDPQGYFTKLQSRYIALMRTADEPDETPKALFVAVEKILADHERLPPDWPVHGGTGYRFSNLVNGLFVDGHHEEDFDRLYSDFIGHKLGFDDVLHQAKLDVIATSLSSDLEVLTEALHRIALGDRRTCDFTRNRLRVALRAVAAAFPVYRTYIGERGFSSADRQHIDWAIASAKRRSRASEVSVIDYLRDIMLGAPTEPDAERRQAMLNLVYRWQQFTAPVMAKSMEDTAFYRYHRLASLNDVGGDPRHFGLSVSAFHAANQHRARFTPHNMLATSTHDTKRSEDVRTRIDVLSEMPQVWQGAIERWQALNHKRTTRIEGVLAPTRNDEYLLYQTLVGVWPLEPINSEALADVCQRVQAYMLKAVREAKEQTSWINPNQAYEAALARFIDALLGQLEPNPFLKDLQALVDQVAPFGAFNSLNLVAFKLTAPGVPDLYQGSETWNFSLVDPDNRRPVDFKALRARHAQVQSLFAGGQADEWALEDLMQNWRDGGPKMLFTWRLLQLRASCPELFSRGSYQALPVVGTAASHVVAYARAWEGQHCITIGSRLLHALTQGDHGALRRPGCWGDTRVGLPVDSPGRWRDVLTGRMLTVSDGPAGGLALSDLLRHWPAAVLVPAEPSANQP
ncbi:malto-oligosyltrehalose synthase [Aquabacterium sp.]|uniref:malto-oligosyltrehalose synthase n=1 Tax=Aquabacterium sp. TaxID=1872578 RepID=UPI0024892021|nr:malto-oligosyltrehalose synthase [Aquabacterium sp.]MDI1261467.1 malto-oligosyltrehalose synthase [Aquabacterium sp.]